MKKLLFLGGDTRMKFAADTLKEAYDITTYGLPNETGIASLENAVTNADVIILPVPSSTDGKTVYAPFATRQITVSDIKKYKCPEALLLTDAQNRFDIPSVAYASGEDFTVKNAYLTAENAMGLLIMSLSYSLKGKNVTLLGYGRIARCLLPLLRAFCCHVTVFSADEDKRAWASVCGADEYDYRHLHDNIKTCDICINTSIIRHLSASDISSTKENFVYMELASGQSGIDRTDVENASRTYIDGGRLPGLYSPQTAGMLIGASVKRILGGNGI